MGVYRSVVVAAVLTISAGCATSGFVLMDVKAYPNPEKPPERIKTFHVVSIGRCNDNDLLEMNVLQLVRNGLERKGLQHSNQSPDALFGVTCYVGPRSQYVPPSTIYWPVPTTTTTTSTSSGTVGGVPFSWAGSSSTTQTRMVPMTRPGYTATDYYRRMSVLAVRPAQISTSEVEQLWLGEVESYGSNADLLVVAPYFIDQLLGEFPRRTNSPTARKVPMASPVIKR